MATYLDRIVEAHRAVAANDRRPLGPLQEEARAARGGTARRGFRAAIDERSAAASGQGRPLAVISEVKRRSPSKGALAADLDPVELARSYEAGGASCLSVLTDVEFFGGSPADLQAARAATALPVLRKDFTVSVRDVYDAAIMGADCVLLIVAALDDAELGEFHAATLDVGLDALVEVHDEAELARALAVGATLVGVNQRDLVTFEVDTARAVRVVPLMPPEVVKVAESGISGPADAAILARAGYDAVLVGESLVRSSDPAAAVAALRAAAAG